MLPSLKRVIDNKVCPLIISEIKFLLYGNYRIIFPSKFFYNPFVYIYAELNSNEVSMQGKSYLSS